MKKVFLDCGAWGGYSVRVFRQIYDPSCEYEIYSFEPNPRYISFPKFENHIFYNKAVWVKDEVRDFYLDNTTRKKAGSSLMEEKTTGNLDKKNPIKVKCIDIDKWIKENFDKDDHIILKLDIEGAEYAVLQHMIINGSLEYINEIFIEWHWHKIGLSKDDHVNLIKQIKIPITERWKVGYKK
jgi:FkbM family methyltransferase